MLRDQNGRSAHRSTNADRSGPNSIASRVLVFGLALPLALALAPALARAQSAVDLQIGRWTIGGPDATYYSAALWRDFWGPFGYNLRGLAVIDRDSVGRSLYGAAPELTVLRGTLSDGPLSVYGVGGPGLALGVGESTALGAIWSAGLAFELRAPSWFSAQLDVRRFAEDGDFRGFWNLDAGDRRGWLAAIGFSVRWGGGPRAPYGGPTSPIPPVSSDPTRPPSAGPSEPASTPAPVLANRIVETALTAMGEPYRWGGTSTAEGFDCSGLVWYAYAQHGVSVPRVSRDQAQAGQPVPADVAALAAGDILLFANRPGTVTHVGLYIGEARFIHATTSGGVRVGSLDSASDLSDSWYLSRWVGARRVLP